MSSHDLTFDQDDDGWDIGSCSCGYDTSPVPGVETAAEIWCGHVIATVTTERIAQLEQWKDEAARALEGWDRVADLFESRPDDLGRPKHQIVTGRITELEAAASAMRVVETYSWWALSEDGGIAMAKGTGDERPGVREEDLERTVREFCDRYPTYRPVRVAIRKTVGPTETLPWVNPWTGEMQS